MNRVIVSTPLPFDSCIRRPDSGNATELILLLHGYAESGERILKKLEPALPPEIRNHALVIAPNAPFPMPHKTETGYTATFSWYFYEPGADDYFVDLAPATQFLSQGLRTLGFSHLPKRIIGFSQGGFLAPIAATALTHVRQLIGIGCEYLVDEIPGKLPQSVPYRVDAIHGSEDHSVDPQRALASHQNLMSHGVTGHFEMIEGATHRIDDRIRQAVAKALRIQV